MTDNEIELRALLTRAAEQEARRQSAREAGDQWGQYQAERELAALWRRYGQLERLIDAHSHQRSRALGRETIIQKR